MEGLSSASASGTGNESTRGWIWEPARGWICAGKVARSELPFMEGAWDEPPHSIVSDWSKFFFFFKFRIVLFSKYQLIMFQFEKLDLGNESIFVWLLLKNETNRKTIWWKKCMKPEFSERKKNAPEYFLKQKTSFNPRSTVEMIGRRVLLAFLKQNALH